MKQCSTVIMPFTRLFYKGVRQNDSGNENRTYGFFLLKTKNKRVLTATIILSSNLCPSWANCKEVQLPACWCFCVLFWSGPAVSESKSVCAHMYSMCICAFTLSCVCLIYSNVWPCRHPRADLRKSCSLHFSHCLACHSLGSCLHTASDCGTS